MINTMPTEQEVYSCYAVDYERLISREDYQHNIIGALQQVCPFAGTRVLDLGAGTGRLTRLVAPAARHVLAFDASHHMLSTAARLLLAGRQSNCHLAVANHRALPLLGGAVDLVLSGWSLCYLAVWGGADWRERLAQSLAEIRRVLRPGGKIVLFETLGTGYEQPEPPAHLLEYYTYLDQNGFCRTWLRTDYRFESLAEAGELSRFFFGNELADRVAAQDLVILPECTGMWWMEVV